MGVSQHPKLTNKSVFHDKYIRPKDTELGFSWCIYMSCGNSGYHSVGAYYGPLVTTLGLKGLTILVTNFTESEEKKSSRLRNKSRHWRCSVKKSVLKFCKFHTKTFVLESLFNKVAAHQDSKFIEKRFQHRCFPVKSVKVLKQLFWRASANDCLLTCILRKARLAK